MFIIEAGLRAEEEGYDAVIMDTASDSGMYGLRSRLTIPVIGPGLVSYAVAAMLGKKFSIITYGSEHKFLYGKNLETYHLWRSAHQCEPRTSPLISRISLIAKGTRSSAP